MQFEETNKDYLEIHKLIKEKLIKLNIIINEEELIKILKNNVKDFTLESIKENAEYFNIEIIHKNKKPLKLIIDNDILEVKAWKEILKLFKEKIIYNYDDVDKYLLKNKSTISQEKIITLIQQICEDKNISFILKEIKVERSEKQ